MTFTCLAQSSRHCLYDSSKLNPTRQTHPALFLRQPRSFIHSQSNRVAELCDPRTKSKRLNTICFFNSEEKSKRSLEIKVIIFMFKPNFSYLNLFTALRLFCNLFINWTNNIAFCSVPLIFLHVCQFKDKKLRYGSIFRILNKDGGFWSGGTCLGNGKRCP